MLKIKTNFISMLHKCLITCISFSIFVCLPNLAYAGDFIDGLNLAPFVPMILDAFLTVATGTYEYFVGNGTGIIYLAIWGFLAVSISLYLIKIYLPKFWLSFFGFSGGGEMWDGKTSGLEITQNTLKPVIRAMLAALIFLQIKPVIITEWLINPFLKLGSVYTETIVNSININNSSHYDIECPPRIIEKGWISKENCNFLVKPISTLSEANNNVVKKGFVFIKTGLRGLISLIPHGGNNIMNIITGILLIFTFVSCNVFMALLIIQALFNFGMALILYPFNVVVWVAKPEKNDDWVDIWSVFSKIITSLKQILITMFACGFIMCVNVAIIRALFRWNSATFIVGSGGGVSVSNVPSVASNAIGFGEHSILWLSSLLTLFLMINIFNLTKEKIVQYAGKDSDSLYKTVISDTKAAYGITKNLYGSFKKIKTIIGK